MTTSEGPLSDLDAPPRRRRAVLTLLVLALLLALIPIIPSIWEWIAVEERREIYQVVDPRTQWIQEFEEVSSVWGLGARRGQRHGWYTAYWPSGKPFEQGRYHNDRQHGVWTEWREDGTVERQEMYDHAHRVETRTAPPWFDGRQHLPPPPSEE